MKRTLRLLPGILALTLLLGCQPGMLRSSGWPFSGAAGNPEPGARLSVFLTLKDSDGPGIRLNVSAVEVLTDDLWLPVAAAPLQLDSRQIGATQVYLGSRTMAPGYYHRLRLTLDEGLVRRSDGGDAAMDLAQTQLELALPAPLLLETRSSRSIFVTWDVQGSLEQTDRLRPAMSVAPPLEPALTGLVYVACPDIDTIFVVRSDKGWVADSFGLAGQPTYLVLDPDHARRRLYVLASRESAIKVVDLQSQRVVDSLHIPLTGTPTFMAISPDARWAYVLEEGSSYLNQIDLETGRSANRVRLDYRPLYASYLAGPDLLAVSASLTQTVFLLDPANLKEVRTIHTGSSPQGLLEIGDQLYIAESGDHMVSIFDLPANRAQNRQDVGFGPHRLLFSGNQIYVSNYQSGSISVLFPGQMGAVREIPGLGQPREMVYDPVYRRLFVGDEAAAGLGVIDTTIDQAVGFVRLGSPPLGLAVIR